jgi:RES domain-containing protein
MPGLSAAEFRGLVYRHCEATHTDLDATLEHNRRHGGRFSPRGEFGAIYVAVERATALRELARHAAFIGFRVDELLPRTLLHLRLHVRNVLDLTDDAICSVWGLPGVDMSTISRGDCWEIARTAHRAGYEAVRFRSATGEGVCFAVFKDRLHPGSYLDIADSEMIDTVDE